MSDGKENRYQKFSVLMSVYYKEDPVFYDAVNSVFENTIPPDDVVIVVDGPIPEGITDVILALREKYELNIVYLSENVGLGRALNIGINYCKYNIIMRMDTDDYCINTRFQEQLDFFPLILMWSFLVGILQNSILNCLILLVLDTWRILVKV